MLFLVLVEASASGEGGYSTNIWVQARVRGLGDPRGVLDQYLGLGEPLSV